MCIGTSTYLARLVMVLRERERERDSISSMPSLATYTLSYQVSQDDTTNISLGMLGWSLSDTPHGTMAELDASPHCVSVSISVEVVALVW